MMVPDYATDTVVHIGPRVLPRMVLRDRTRGPKGKKPIRTTNCGALKEQPPLPIDKGIPMPPFRGGNPAGTAWLKTITYPWRQMEVGDSFRMPAHLDVRTARAMAAAAMAWPSKRGYGRYQIRTYDDNGERIVRVWRTA